MIRKAVNVEYLTVTDFELIVDDLIALREVFTEDIPPFQTRYPGKLEGIAVDLSPERINANQNLPA